MILRVVRASISACPRKRSSSATSDATPGFATAASSAAPKLMLPSFSTDVTRAHIQNISFSSKPIDAMASSTPANIVSSLPPYCELGAPCSPERY